MKKIKLEILGMSYSQSQSGAYTLILGEPDSHMKLPITIGGFEAQAIALKLEGITPKRPLTHDLIKSILESIEVKLIEVVISQFLEGIFYSKLIIEVEEGRTLAIDSRTSDAVAIAVRTDTPIYTYPEVIDKAGIVLKNLSPDEEEEKQKEKSTEEENKKDELSALSIEELESLMNEAIEAEDFEHASELRDEIKRKKSKL